MEDDMLDIVAGGYIGAYEPGDRFDRIADFPLSIEITRVQSDTENTDDPTNLSFGIRLDLVDEKLLGTVSGTDESKLSDLIRDGVGAMADGTEAKEAEALEVLRQSVISYGRRRSLKVAVGAALTTVLSYRATESIIDGRLNQGGTRNVLGLAILALVGTGTTFWSAHTSEPSRHITQEKARWYARVSHQRRLLNAAKKALTAEDNGEPSPVVSGD